MEKSEIIELYENVEQIPDDGCVRFDQCGNTFDGREKMCPECLDEAREAQRNGEELGWNV